MKRLKVAIVDSGIMKGIFKEVKGDYEEYYVNSEHQIVNVDSNYQVSNIHGTICCAIIQKYASNVDIISIQVVKQKRSCDIMDMINALEFCIAMKVDIINMSLGAVRLENIIQMYQCIEKVNKANILLIAPIGKFGRIAYPGGFSNVWGIDALLESMEHNKVHIEYSYNLKKEVILVEGRQKLMLQNGEEYYSPNYSSFAVPVIVGIICQILSDEHGMVDKNLIKERLKEYVFS